MPSLFDSVDSFSIWFGQQSSSAGETAAELSEEESLLVTNRLHQVLRPFVLRRLKEAVAADLPAKVTVLPCWHICWMA